MNASSYTWDASDYARYSSAQFQWAQQLLAKLELIGSEVLLDIGCGDGRVTAMISRQLPTGSVVGIDNSEGMTAHARRQYSGPNYPNLIFRHMDATKLSFDRQFDIIFSNASLHWVEDHLAVLRGVKRSLKCSGKMLFQMGGRGNAAEILELLEQVILRERWRPYFQNFSFPYWFYGPEEYRTWLKEVGLHTTRVELIPKDMQHRGREGLAGWIRTTWLPYSERIPEDKRNQFISEIVDAYSELYPIDQAGMVHVKMMRLEIEAHNN